MVRNSHYCLYSLLKRLNIFNLYLCTICDKGNTGTTSLYLLLMELRSFIMLRDTQFLIFGVFRQCPGLACGVLCTVLITFSVAWDEFDQPREEVPGLLCWCLASFNFHKMRSVPFYAENGFSLCSRAFLGSFNISEPGFFWRSIFRVSSVFSVLISSRIWLYFDNGPFFPLYIVQSFSRGFWLRPLLPTSVSKGWIKWNARSCFKTWSKRKNILQGFGDKVLPGGINLLLPEVLMIVSADSW